MKLYNPFKPHFCEFGDGQFGMRRLSFFPLNGWTYLDTCDMRFWSESKYSGSRHQDLAVLKNLVAERLASIKRAKDAKKSRRIS